MHRLGGAVRQLDGASAGYHVPTAVMRRKRLAEKGTPTASELP